MTMIHNLDTASRYPLACALTSLMRNRGELAETYQCSPRIALAAARAKSMEWPRFSSSTALSLRTS